MQAFAPPTPLLSPMRSGPSACLRRPVARAASLTSARATLTPDRATATSFDMKASALTPSENWGELSASDQARIDAVRVQMEFWFSSSNLRRDWYLRRQMDEQGWLDPSVFLLFNRIKTLKASLDDIILACRMSTELEVSAPPAGSFGDEAAQTRVRRNPDLPDFRENDDDELSRSFIVKGIPTNSTIDSLQAIFQPIAPVSYLRIYRNKNFPDTPRALICFEDDETAERVFELFKANPPEEAGGISLRRRNAKLADPSEQSTSPMFEHRPGVIVCQLTGLTADLDWKVLYDSVERSFVRSTGEPIRFLMYNSGATDCYITVADSETARALITSLEEDGLMISMTKTAVRRLEDHEELTEYWRMAEEYQAVRRARRAEREANVIPASDLLQDRHPAGVIVKIEGLSDTSSWRDIRSDLVGHGKLVYLNYEKNSTVCYARFSTPEEANTVRDALSGADPVLIGGKVVKASVLAGEEEIQYWTKAEEIRKQRQLSKENTLPSGA